MTKKILFNASNIVKGGAIQAAVNFILINQTRKFDEFEWYFILSKEVFKEVQLLGCHTLKNTLITNISPSKNKSIRQKILDYEKETNPKLVFTLFGPCYIKFNNTHITGFANGWVTHSRLSTFKNTYKGNIIKIIKAMMKYFYYAFHIRNADAWIFETLTAKKGFINRLRVQETNCHVVKNSCFDFKANFSKKKSENINTYLLNYADNLIVALAANYPHKNLFSLLEVALILKNKVENCKFKFVFTVDEDVFLKDFQPFIIKHNIQKFIVNIGKVNIVNLPKLYSVAFVSVLPSFIETSSSVYPESFATNTPVITTNAEFAQEICKKAALYINPKSSEDIAKAINVLINDKLKYNKLIQEGQKLFLTMPTIEQKYQAYIKIFSSYFK